MTAIHSALRQRSEWESRYLGGFTPWDTGETPPEVREFWRSKLIPASGLSLDMGCGTGTNVAFLASLGMLTIGIELSHTALAAARKRQGQMLEKSAARAHFVQGDVSATPLNNLGASYVLDVGCLHAVPRSRRHEYADAVVKNLAPGGFYHLFSHDVPLHQNQTDDDVRGLGESEVEHLFTPGLSLLTVTRGRPDPRPCRWYLLHKP